MRRCSAVQSIHHHDEYVSIMTDGAEIRVWFVTDAIIRIRVGFDTDFTEASYSLVTTAWDDQMDDLLGDARRRVTPCQITVTETDDAYLLQGPRAQVRVDKHPFRISVIDEDGTCLHRDLEEIAYREDRNGRRIHSSEIATDDAFYGFGERTGNINKARQSMVLSASDSMAYDPQHSDGLYKHIPFYIKLSREHHKAVGYFYHNTYSGDFTMGRTHSNYWPHASHYRVDGGDIDLFIILGPSIHQVIEGYTSLTGTSAMLPAAAFGYLGSSMYYPELPEGADEAVIDFIDTARDYQIPIDGFHLSSGYTHYETPEGSKRCVLTWNQQRFGSPEGFFSQMNDRGVVVSPNVKPGVLASHPYLEYLIDHQMLVRQSASDQPAPAAWWGGHGYVVDFTDPHAREEWKRLLTTHLLAHGTWSVWNDNCEYESILDDDARCSYEGHGASVAQLRSVMANLMCATTVEAIGEQFPDKRPYVVCRAGHSGIQRYAQTWAGDNCTSWESLRGNIATILGMGISGVAHHGTDIGGFYGPAPEPELFVRWVQHGIFQPRFSIHSTNTDNTVTEPWMYSDHLEHIRAAINLRYRLFPYLYSLARRAHERGLPIVQPMVACFQHDENCYGESVDFMLGEALLVATVVEPGATTREVYLPAGERFYDLATRTPYEGGQRISVPVDISSIPLFVRSGQILPMAEEQLMNLSRERVHTMRLICAPDKDGCFTLYEDDGASNAYTDGHYAATTIQMSAGEQVRLAFRRQGDYRSDIRTMILDIIHPQQAPYWVSVAGERLPHFLNRRAYERAERGWYYSQRLRSVEVKYPHLDADYDVCVSFENFDLIGM